MIAARSKYFFQQLQDAKMQIENVNWNFGVLKSEKLTFNKSTRSIIKIKSASPKIFKNANV